jgi:hypothetical protein
MDERILQVEQIVRRIKPILAHNPPDIVGAALADLLAIWLASHIVIDDLGETAAMRDRLIESHVAMVRELIPINEAEITR